MLPFFLIASVLTQAQAPALTAAEKKAAEVKKLETALTLAKNKVALNQRQIKTADSLITAGTEMIADGKTETKAVTNERKTVDKTYETAKKPLLKQSTSKDKGEVTQAKAEIKTLDTQYKADIKALDTRLKAATKNSVTGTANVTKGKANKKTAQDALKLSGAALKTAQAKYDAATGSGNDSASKGKKKK